MAAPAHAQTPPPSPATPPAQATPEPVAPVVAIVGEEYRVELQVGAWVTMPSTVVYSDTETLTQHCQRHDDHHRGQRHPST